MRRTISALLAALALAGLTASAALAHDAGPCSGTARDYAAHHVVFQAQAGTLGAGGHVPGSHMGFSACLDVH